MNNKPNNIGSGAGMYLPGMEPAVDGCRIIIKPKHRSWREEADELLKPKTYDLKKASSVSEKPSSSSSLEKPSKKQQKESTPAVQASPSPRAVTATLPKMQLAPAAMETPEQVRIRELEQRLAAIERGTKADLAQIQEETSNKKLEIRRLATKEEATTLSTAPVSSAVFGERRGTGHAACLTLFLHLSLTSASWA